MKGGKFVKVFAVSFEGYPKPNFTAKDFQEVFEKFVWKTHEEMNKGVDRDSKKWKGLSFSSECVEITSLLPKKFKGLTGKTIHGAVK